MRLLLLLVLTRFSHAIGADFSLSIYRRTLFQPYELHEARNSSEIIAGVSNKANSMVSSLILPSLNIISSIQILLSILSALIVIEPLISLSTFGGFGFICW